MKFGESLSEGLVPEWKDQYVHYKVGKEQIKRLSAVLENSVHTDTTPLLNPQTETQQYVPGTGDNEHNPQAAQEGEQSKKSTLPSKSSVRSSMRGSVFKFSSKTPREQLDSGKGNFLVWIGEELAMVDAFYKEKERDVYHRYLILEDQFFQLKEHKTELVARSKEVNKGGERRENVNVKISRWTFYVKSLLEPLSRYELPSLPSTTFLERMRPKSTGLDLELKRKSQESEYGPNFRENQIRNGVLEELDFDDDASDDSSVEITARPAHPTPSQLRYSGRRDYEVKKHFGVPYFYAKRQLKNALIEHYRSIALIRSYRTMNRTALRKITKKFDKATNSSVSPDFMKRVDSESYFQTSGVLDKISNRVEDMFLTYFDNEKSDRKRGLEKLKSATYTYNDADIRTSQYHASIFTSGLMSGIAIPLFGIALFLAVERTLSGALPEGKFLLQVWGGFFLIILTFYLVGINFVVYNHFKINYRFIFEFNLANALDFRQVFFLPSLGFALLAIMAWLSFENFWPDKLPGRTWPLIYLASGLILFLWPGTQLYPHCRRWVQIALWRILCSGLYPVEFRDFFIGDILCSLTYTMGNISFFVCLYADKWRHILGSGTAPASTEMCGSSHSRSMGFFSALPSIWRFLQCVRRYMDSGDAFPHLANMTKYLVSAIYYCFLSVWRIEKTTHARALFITFACINSIFTSVWDIVMDWSLGQTRAKHYLLRDNLFYEKPIYYYAAMIIDVILRFQWIFYAFFSSQVQQSAVTSFCIALAEILRRFIWMFFRMENEHCANVVLFRASRESPLPYMVTSKVERAVQKLIDLRYKTGLQPSDEDFSTDNEDIPRARKHALSGYSGENGASGSTAVDERTYGVAQESSVKKRSQRRKSTILNISEALKKAHIKDFQRKKYSYHVEESDEEDDLDDDAASHK